MLPPCDNGTSRHVRATASCHCGRIQYSLKSAPAQVVSCNCSLCRRYGVLWAYYDGSEIDALPAEGLTQTYAWGGKNVDFHHCKTCGCVTHWAPRSAKRTRYGVNARLLEPAILSAARIRYKDGAGSGKMID